MTGPIPAAGVGIDKPNSRVRAAEAGCQDSQHCSWEGYKGRRVGGTRLLHFSVLCPTPGRAAAPAEGGWRRRLHHLAANSRALSAADIAHCADAPPHTPTRQECRSWPPSRQIHGSNPPPGPALASHLSCITHRPPKATCKRGRRRGREETPVFSKRVDVVTLPFSRCPAPGAPVGRCGLIPESLGS